MQKSTHLHTRVPVESLERFHALSTTVWPEADSSKLIRLFAQRCVERRFSPIKDFDFTGSHEVMGSPKAKWRIHAEHKTQFILACAELFPGHDYSHVVRAFIQWSISNPTLVREALLGGSHA